VDSSVDYKMTAERLVWGKCMNMGQSCIAPDYVVCSKAVEAELVKHCKLTMDAWYGSDWKKAKDLARIVNLRHFNRIKRLIHGTKRGKVVMGGEDDEQALWIQPTLVGRSIVVDSLLLSWGLIIFLTTVDCSEDDEIMEEEIFGPVLAFYTVDTEDEAIQFINSRWVSFRCHGDEFF
jgi:acyl-CoA reductase-like NAD-dependent aldehyde dehydrogenase